MKWLLTILTVGLIVGVILGGTVAQAYPGHDNGGPAWWPDVPTWPDFKLEYIGQSYGIKDFRATVTVGTFKFIWYATELGKVTRDHIED